MKYVSPTSGIHIHAWHPGNRRFPVDGYPIAYFSLEDGVWVTYAVMGENIVSLAELQDNVRPKRVEVVPFGVLDECCNLNRG